jgi:hypothetical protein
LVDALGRKVPVEIRTTVEVPLPLLESVDQAKKLDSSIVSGLLLLNGEPRKNARIRFEAAGWAIFDASELHVDPADVGRLRTYIATVFRAASHPNAT